MNTSDMITRLDLTDEEVAVLTEDEMRIFIAALRYERIQFIQDIHAITASWKEGNIDAQFDTSVYQSELETAGDALNNMIREISKPISLISKNIEMIALGEIPTPIINSFTGDLSIIIRNLNTLISFITDLAHDTESLSTAALKGNLNTRIDSSKYLVDFKKIIESVNRTLDEFDKSKVSTNGDNSHRLNADLMMIEDIERVKREIDQGSLKALINEENYSGDSRVIVDSINHLIKSLSEPLTIFATTINQTSTGKIPDRIPEEYSGDLAKIASDLNTTIDALALLVSDGLLLTKAIEEGKLGIRTDVTRHQGQFRAVIGGFNNTLDAVVKPLNLSAEYVDRISKGDIPDKITDEYYGDFNEIKNNLNVCIEAINRLVSDGLLLTKAIEEGKLGTRADTSKHFGEFRAVIDGFNNTLDAVVKPLNLSAEYVDRISKGDIPDKITDEYYGDFNEIKNNLNVCIEAINRLVSDGLLLTKAIEEGKLGTRADTTHHFGEFRAVIGGFNNTLDAVVKPLNMSAEYMDRISKGDIPDKITDEYYGDFNEIKNNLNVCIEAINRLVSDGLLLTKAIEEGKLGTRTDTTHHFGEFRAVIGGFNNTLDAVVKPLNMSAEYMDRISKGDIPDKITDEYYGDFNEIKNNLNVCIEAINRLVSDGLLLTKAIEEGKLGTRADTSKHFGEFRAVIDGFNNTLDAVVKPLNLSAEYVDRISKGDIPDKITDEYYGDFNEIKNNLNVCIEAINRLVSDGLLLTKAIEEGKLGTRADTTHHFGEFRAVIGGFNNTLDAVVKPLNMSAEYMDRISKGDIPDKITDEYYGDFNEIKNNLNVCIEAINRLVSDGLLLTKAIEEGKLGTRADTTHHFGEFRAIISGFNSTLDAVVKPLNISAEYMDRISKGDIPDKITDEYYGDFNEIKNNLNVCIEAINRLVSDGLLLTKAIEEGKLGTRADITHHFGEFRAVISGFNNTLDAVVKPLNMSAEYMDRISKGDIPDKIIDEYYGDFNEIKNNLNVCIEAINRLVSDGLLLTKAIEEGKLGTRADITHHFGEFRAVISGFNNTLDAVVKPLNMSAEYMDRISKGDIPDKITDEYYGDFNEIKNNLNVCIDAINRLVSDGLLLTKAIEEGKLGTRVDTSKHFGEFRSVILGFNNTVDAIIKPLNRTAEYLDRISKGDIPEKITENSQGDFNEIKNNLNVCIDAINRLVTDGLLLTKAIEEGKLSTRSDISKHQGNFKEVILGFNETLDIMMKPLNEAMRLSLEYSSYNFSARFDENLIVTGDFTMFKDSLNKVGMQISEALNVVNSKVMEIASATEEANASTEEVAAGAREVTASSEMVSVNAEQSNESLSQVLRAMEDLSVTVGQVSGRADSVSKIAYTTNELCYKGTDVAKKAEMGMEGITKSTEEVSIIVSGIKTQMQEIGKIVSLISDIANQTNLLALNAAIEAARAGDAGRGFAVVASEVKSLAQESRHSAENIASMITDLQQKSEQASKAMTAADIQVKTGNAALSETLQVFNSIVGSVEEINKSMVDVASASEEQAASVQEITASISEVSNLVQGTSTEAQKSSITTGETSVAIDQISSVINGLSSIAETLSQEVIKFRL
ncbi:methyl-accepting chemotaxis protein [Methanospirillum lacunae]|nr:methyl-accepting chemotaxis protein [Methanospirillum lacunae]